MRFFASFTMADFYNDIDYLSIFLNRNAPPYSGQRMNNTLLPIGNNQPGCWTSSSAPTPVQTEQEPSLKRFLNLQRFARDVAEEGSLAHRLELFGSERERLDGEVELEVLSDVKEGKTVHYAAYRTTSSSVVLSIVSRIFSTWAMTVSASAYSLQCAHWMTGRSLIITMDVFRQP
jgi:hypothetical protein